MNHVIRFYPAINYKKIVMCNSAQKSIEFEIYKYCLRIKLSTHVTSLSSGPLSSSRGWKAPVKRSFYQGLK